MQNSVVWEDNIKKITLVSNLGPVTLWAPDIDQINNTIKVVYNTELIFQCPQTSFTILKINHSQRK